VKKKQEVLSLLQEQVGIIWHTVQKYLWSELMWSSQSVQ